MNSDVLELAKRLIRCPSITPDSAGVMDVLEDMLTPLGFVVHRQTFDEPEEAPVENLYARLGTEGPNLCFAGHTDVVPPGDEALWDSPPFEPEVRDGVLYGRGAEDMKGAIAAFIAAVSRVAGADGKAINGSISLLITNDEEGIAINGTRKMLEWLSARGETIDACLVGEPTNPNTLGEMIKVGRRGSITCDLFVRGRQGHVAYPDRADNPVKRLVNALNEMQNYMLDSGSEFFPPSHFEVTSVDVGNPTVNLIPDSAHAKFNIRFNDQHSSASIAEWLHDVCIRHIGARDEAYELRSRVSGESFLTRDDALIAPLAEAVAAVTGRTPELSTTGGISDARFIKDICPVIEFGTTGGTAHAVNECVAIDTLEQLTHVYERFLQHYFAAAHEASPAKASPAQARQYRPVDAVGG